MDRLHLIIVACAALASVTPRPSITSEGAPPAQPSGTLVETITALDVAVFDAFNQCRAAEQLQKHAAYFDSEVEFYHDTGGVTWTRDAMLANTKQYVCGKFRRELVPGSLHVHPVKDFGAIAQGSHRFLPVRHRRLRRAGRRHHRLAPSGWRVADHTRAQLRPSPQYGTDTGGCG